MLVDYIFPYCLHILLSLLGRYADKASDARKENLVPIGLVQNAVMKRAVPVGTLLTYDDVELDENSLIVKLRREQDAMGLTYAS